MSSNSNEPGNDRSALARAVTVQANAAAVGFDFAVVGDAFAKIEEEVAELRATLEAEGQARDAIEDELGDLLFAAVNVARMLGIDPEVALERTNAKFDARYAHIERRLAVEGRTLEDASLDEMERYWVEAKGLEDGRAG